MTELKEKDFYQNTVDYDLGRSMRQNIARQIAEYILDEIMPSDENIMDYDDLLDYVWDDNRHGKGVGGWSYKRLNIPDAKRMTDLQFETLCKMATVRDTIMDIYPE